MRVDFAIISLLNTEHEIYASALQELLIYAKVPRRDLKAMKEVAGDFFRWHTFVHDVMHTFHLKLIITIKVHKALLE